MLVSAISVVNQEAIIPYLGEELARRHDDDGEQKINVSSRYDSSQTMIHGRQADRATRTIMPFYATTDVKIFGQILALDGQQATYIPPDHPTAPLKGGWLVREATINPPHRRRDASGQQWDPRPCRRHDALPAAASLDDRDRQIGPLETRHARSRPAGVLTPHSEIAYLAALPPLPLSLSFELWRTQALLDRRMEIGRGTYFLKSSLTFQAMTRKANWYQFAADRPICSRV